METREIRKEINFTIDKRPVERQSATVCGWAPVCFGSSTKKKVSGNEGKERRHSSRRFGVCRTSGWIFLAYMWRLYYPDNGAKGGYV